MSFKNVHLALLMLPLCAACGCSSSDAGPSLLVQQVTNGVYKLSANGSPTDPLLFTTTLASGDPVQNSGTDYFSAVTGTIVDGPGANLGSCAGSTINISGKITNPNVNDVFINMTGATAGSGTLTITGRLLGSPVGTSFAGTVAITGGSCPATSLSFVAVH